MQDPERRAERHRLARASQRLAQARRHARLKSESGPQLDAILASTSWKVALLSRRIAGLLPDILRKSIRLGIGTIWRQFKPPRP